MIREALTFERLDAMEPDEAAALFVARRAEGLTPSEETMLADWLSADEAHSRALGRAERAWTAFGDAEGDEILEAMRVHARGPQVRGWTSWRAAAAAILVLLVGSAVLLVTLNRNPGPSPEGDRATVLRYASARGQVREIVLPDGSRMTLDAESAALIRFATVERSIRLERGRALFEVAADRSRPFAVTAASRRVVATGTRFEVNMLANALTVTLLEGHVTVGPLDRTVRPIELRAGQQFVDRGGTPILRTLEGTSAEPTSWRQGLLDFDDIPLAEATAEVNRYSRDQLVIRDREIGALRISGQFRAGEAERFARTVAEVHPVRVVRRGNELQLVPAS